MKIHLYLEIPLPAVQALLDANKQFNWVVHSTPIRELDTINQEDEDLSYFLIAAFPTPRNAAFRPGVSPPDVNSPM